MTQGAAPLNKVSLINLCTCSGRSSAMTNVALSLSARLLHGEEYPPRSESEAQEVRGKCVLWMQPLLRDNEDNLLIRVECPLTMEHHMYERKRVLLGHLLHWEGIATNACPNSEQPCSRLGYAKRQMRPLLSKE